jgi:type IV pilus assembly protein PilV
MNIQTPSKQRGVMLLEALVGILIFSIGILAMLGMQTIGMRNTIESKYRSEASYLGTQIIGTMWVDRANLANYDDAVGNTNRNNWVTQVQNTLPQATGVNVPSIVVVGTQVTVTIRWLRPGEAAADRSQHTIVAAINGAT